MNKLDFAGNTMLDISDYLREQGLSAPFKVAYLSVWYRIRFIPASNEEYVIDDSHVAIHFEFDHKIDNVPLQDEIKKLGFSEVCQEGPYEDTNFIVDVRNISFDQFVAIMTNVQNAKKGELNDLESLA